VTIDSDLGSSQWQQVDALANKFPDKQKAIDSINAQLQKLSQIMKGDVPAFNQLVRDQNIPAIVVKPQ
jgi:hypothetical protein